jgi:DNA invertase Pin-like site-specific DNA recombinase
MKILPNKQLNSSDNEIKQEEESELIPIFRYYRISTNTQKLRAQKKSQDRFLERNKEKYVVKGTFEDIVSGTIGPEGRPEYNEMINRLDEVDSVLCSDWDRMSRDLQFATYFMFFLRNSGVTILESDTGKEYDFNKMGDRIWAYLKSEMAAQELIKKKERQKSGIAGFIEEKGRWGPEKKYGGGSDGKLWTKSTFWKKYKNLRLSGVSKSAIARLFKISLPTLYKRLREEQERYDKIERKVKNNKS